MVEEIDISDNVGDGEGPGVDRAVWWCGVEGFVFAIALPLESSFEVDAETMIAQDCKTESLYQTALANGTVCGPNVA